MEKAEVKSFRNPEEVRKLHPDTNGARDVPC
jgi:hypothetical protein